MLKIQHLIQQDKDLRSNVIRMRRQLIDLHKELQGLYLEIEEGFLDSN